MAKTLLLALLPALVLAACGSSKPAQRMDAGNEGDTASAAAPGSDADASGEAPDAPDLGADASDGSPDASCAPNPLFFCLSGTVGNCGDTGQPGVCAGGQWTCPPGTVSPTQCGPCSGPPPPAVCQCTATGWVCPQ